MSKQPTQITVSGQRPPPPPELPPVNTEGAVKAGAGEKFAPIRTILVGFERGSGAESERRNATNVDLGVKGARSLYIHVPFCFHKCHYCDFYSFVDKGDQQGAFVEALVMELRAMAGLVSGGTGLSTVFVGGGTPSLLRVDLWRDVLGVLDELFGVRALARSGGLEFTVECNPETVTPELMGVLAAGGVNRVSIGAQSFNTAHLKTLERWHDPVNVERAVRMARDAGIARRSIDLIFGVPGQTLPQWRDDLGRALVIADDPSGGLEHLSCYNLTYEPNTAMTKRLERGDFAASPEELEIEMFRMTREVLRDAGFEAYEVSNFARGESARCRHNMAYWRQEQCLAAGPSASGHVAGWRWKNTPNIGEWMRSVKENAGVSAAVDVEPPDGRRALRERLMTGLRLSEGLSVAAMLEQARLLDLEDALTAASARVMGKGLMTDDAGVWRLTEAGVLVGDSVSAEIFAGLRP